MSAWAVMAVHLSTAQIADLQWDGDVLWAATGGGLEAWSAAGEHLATASEGLPRAALTSVASRDGVVTVGTAGDGQAWWSGDAWVVEGHGTVAAVLPSGVVGADSAEGTVRDAVEYRGAVVAGTLSGELLILDENRVRRVSLPGPALDLEVVDDTVRIACGAAAAVWDGELRVLDVPATAAGPVWGTARGTLVDDEGVVATLPAPITAVEALPGHALAIGTTDGLYRLDSAGLVRLTPARQLCGNFLTGATTWRGKVVVSTFDQGACVLEDDGWHAIPGLPSTMVNDVLADGDGLWLATSAGLAHYDGEQVVTYGAAGWEAPRFSPGVHHAGVNALARADRLWVADVVGPVSVDSRDRWRRHRLHVWGTSYQAIAACGTDAWVASEDAGVSWTDGRRWTHHDAETGLPDDWIMAVACEGPARAWAGTYQDGVWRWDGSAWSELAGLPDPWVLALESADDGLWTGTMAGLYRWDGETWTETAGLPHPIVHDVFVDAGGERVLVATEGGLAVLGRE